MKVLISCDSSAAGEHVLLEAQKFLALMPDVEVYVYSVIDIGVVAGTGLYANGEIVQSLEESAQKVNQWGQKIFEGKDIHFATEVGYPAEMVVKKAKELRVDLLILGTHGKTGINRLLIGSVAEDVLRHTYCNTLVIPIKHLVNG